ncbi:MAG: hypothetical protein ACREBU_00935 [Nitrososphaera sp.]
MELPKFQVEGKEYQLRKLPTERQIEALKATYMKVNKELKGKTKHERKKYKWKYLPDQMAITGGTLEQCFGYTKSELDDMENIVTMKLFYVLMHYLVAGKVSSFP